MKNAAGQNKTMVAPVTQASLVLLPSLTPATLGNTSGDALHLLANLLARQVLILQRRDIRRLDRLGR